jgi:hypothetical protein
MKPQFFKRFFFSLLYSLPGTIGECAILLLLLVGGAFLYSMGAPVKVILLITFLSIFGGQQFSREVIEKMEEKFGKNNY